MLNDGPLALNSVSNPGRDPSLSLHLAVTRVGLRRQRELPYRLLPACVSFERCRRGWLPHLLVTRIQSAAAARHFIEHSYYNRVADDRGNYNRHEGLCVKSSCLPFRQFAMHCR